MRRHLRAAMVFGLLASGSAWADTDEREEEVDSGELPPHVERALRTALPRANVLDAERRDDGWEATVRVGLRSERVRLDANGNLVERAMPVSPRELPEAVLETLDRVHPRSTIWRVERIESGDEAFHEVLLARGDRRTSVVLDDEGRIVTGKSRT